MAIRAEVQQLMSIGSLPVETGRTPQQLLDLLPHVARFQECLQKISKPVTMEEAAVLVTLFPEDGTACGLAWSLLTLVETCSSVQDVLVHGDPANPWVNELKERQNRAKNIR